MALKIRSTENRTFSTTVHLEGRLDNATVAALDEELDRIIASAVTVVVSQAWSTSAAAGSARSFASRKR